MGVIAVVLVVSAPGRSNIAFGQASVIVVALAAADLLLLVNRRTAGVLLGVAIAVKLTPLLFVPLLWWSGRRRQARMAMATGAAVTAVAWLIFPSQSEAYWLHDVVDAGRFVNVSIAGNQSLRAFLERDGVHSQLLWLMVAAFVAALSVGIGVRLARQHQWFFAVGVVGTCSVIVSPISWTHHQFCCWFQRSGRPRSRTHSFVAGVSSSCWS